SCSSNFVIQFQNSMPGRTRTGVGIEHQARRGTPQLDDFLYALEWLYGTESMALSNYLIKLVDADLAMSRFLVFPRHCPQDFWRLVIFICPKCQRNFSLFYIL